MLSGQFRQIQTRIKNAQAEHARLTNNFKARALNVNKELNKNQINEFLAKLFKIENKIRYLEQSLKNHIKKARLQYPNLW